MNDKARDITDTILDRHMWLDICLQDTLVLFTKKYLKKAKKNTDCHPDAILAAYLNSNLKQVLKRQFRSFYKITKDGVSSVSNFQYKDLKGTSLGFDIEQMRILNHQIQRRERLSQQDNNGFVDAYILIALIFYSLVPASWAKKWNDEQSIFFIKNYGYYLLNHTAVNSQEDLVNLLHPYKGDLSKIFNYDENIVNVKILPADFKGEINKSKLELEYNNFLTQAASHRLREVDDMFINLKQTIINSLVYFIRAENITSEFRNTYAKKLIGENSLYKLSIKSNTWHQIVDNLNRITNGTDNEEPNWKPLCHDYKINDILITPLVTIEDLIEEGSKRPDKNGIPGLNHCVGSYSYNCKQDGSHVVSIRQINEDGTYTRLSTAEFKYNENNKTIFLKQHSGDSNTVPNEKEKIALNLFIDNFNSEKIEHFPEGRTQKISKKEQLYPIEMEAIALQNLIVAWKPVLAKKYKDIDMFDLINDFNNDYYSYEASRKPKRFEYSDIFKWLMRKFKRN